jgi:hypothetical protein
MRSLFNLRNISYVISLTLAIGLLAFIVFQNLTPFGITTKYVMQSKNDHLSSLGPRDRVKEINQKGRVYYKQIDDIIYFSTNMPFHFDSATIRMQIKNDTPEQAVKVGYKDKGNWHYRTKVVDLPLIKEDEWSTIGQAPVLYQRNNTYKSLNSFYQSPPKESLVGLYDYNKDKLLNNKLSGYEPKKNTTVINVPIRGKVIMYAYLMNESFIMKITKQDLNRNKDNDAVAIKIFKDDEQVFATNINDDGVTDSSRKITKEQSVTIKNPGTELPEPGVYKIIIYANEDTILKQITTNLNKIVFESPIYLAGNANDYSPVVPQTKQTTLYTDALLLSFIAKNSYGLQRITTPTKTLRLTTRNKEGQIIPDKNITPIKIPENDVVIQAFAGYIAFERNQLFQPTIVRTIPITGKTDIELVDYLITEKKPANQQGEWRTVEQTYNIEDAVVDNGKLSWLIQAPRLKDSGKEITIGNVEVSLHKNPSL